MRRLIATFTLAIMVLTTSAAVAQYYANSGDFWYGGGNYADSYLRWTSPGPFSHGDVGYEHDLDVGSGFATTCTAWTNLPYGYDDCPTAGTSDPAGRRIFSFGSFHINNVTANYTYFGSWTMKQRDCANCPEHDPVGSTGANLRGEENQRQFCFFDSIWCMNGIRSAGLLVNVPLSVGTTRYESWSY